MSDEPLTSDQDAVLQITDIHAILKLWDEKNATPIFDPIHVLTRLAELFEEETKLYMRRNPDPFDDSHPYAADPSCEFGRMLKLLFRKDNFISKLTDDYLRDNFFTRHRIQKSSFDLNVAACRLILLILPALDITNVFTTEDPALINRLYSWAENSNEPLRSYAVGLLGAAMHSNEIPNSFREQNASLVTIMLKRLHASQKEELKELQQKSNGDEACSDLFCLKNKVQNLANKTSYSYDCHHTSRPFAQFGGSFLNNLELNNPTVNEVSKFKFHVQRNTVVENENSSQSESQYFRNIIPIYPPTTETIQMLILHYLSSLGQYQELLGQVFENNAMQIIFRYIEELDHNGTGIGFEALKYLSSLLCHKRFVLEFITSHGVERLIKVPRLSIAATGVASALYCLSYCEDAMERICLMSKEIVPDLVTYVLSLFCCSHNSGRCHAILFFRLSFQFKTILDEFDRQDGLRKLYNIVAVDSGDVQNMNEEHVCVAIKKYMECHLYFKYCQITRSSQDLSSSPSLSVFRAPKQRPEMISEHVRTLQEHSTQWEPVENILYLNIIPFLLRIITNVYDKKHRLSNETVQAALEVLNICCAIPKAHLQLCDHVNLPNEKETAGINVILGAAEGGIMADVEVQKAALAILVHCICPSTGKPVTLGRNGMLVKKREEISKKVWKSVRFNNGIFVLLQLMEMKTPITDADCIRGMACQALAGLAHSEKVQQIIGKLPLFTNGQLENLIRDPILQEKRTEHVQFQRYALELMDRISGKPKSSKELRPSLANIHKANVVAQTKIQFNEQQLFELIYVHLLDRGMHETAASLQREAGLTTKVVSNNLFHHHSTFPFRFPNTSLVRARMLMTQSDSNVPTNSVETETLNSVKTEQVNVVPALPPIKLIKKSSQFSSTFNNNYLSMINQQEQRSLQKQTNAVEYNGTIPTNSRLNQREHFSNNITLDTIITEYLTNQHALCKSPMSTCPQFDLFAPHKCPDQRRNKIKGLNSNFASRCHLRQAGYCTQYLDRRLVHSQFCMARTIRSDSSVFTCCDFTPYTNTIAVGTNNGKIEIFNNDNATKYTSPCQKGSINNIKCSKDGTLLLTSSLMQSVMWSMDTNQLLMKLALDEEKYLEFSNLNEDKILGTTAKNATIYDVQTLKRVSIYRPTIENQYTRNRATFCPSDDLILFDGVLFDVRSGVEIHKFDKLNQTLSGVFHPSGLEIVSNTEVWDLRTFHLLRTVPALDQTAVTFSPQNVMYGMSLFSKRENDKNSYDSKFKTFKTLDSYDYTSIATIDVKRNIFDLSVNSFGNQIALVENLGNIDTQDTVVRIYSVGRGKIIDDDSEEDETDMPDSLTSSGNSANGSEDEWMPPEGTSDADDDDNTDMEEDQSNDDQQDDDMNDTVSGDEG